MSIWHYLKKKQNFHRQHDHQHKKLSRGKHKSDIRLSKLIFWENKIEINTKTLYNEFSIKLFTTICKIIKKIAKIIAAHWPIQTQNDSDVHRAVNRQPGFRPEVSEQRTRITNHEATARPPTYPLERGQKPHQNTITSDSTTMTIITSQQTTSRGNENHNNSNGGNRIY